MTGSLPGLSITTVSSSPVTLSRGTIEVTADSAVTGAVQVGATIQGHPGVWDSLQSTATSTWQWRVDGVDIPGATSIGYQVRPDDLGKTLRLAQHVTAPAYDATTVDSLDTAPVAIGTLIATTPTIGGKRLVGRTLTVRPGAWTREPPSPMSGTPPESRSGAPPRGTWSSPGPCVGSGSPSP